MLVPLNDCLIKKFNCFVDEVHGHRFCLGLGITLRAFQFKNQIHIINFSSFSSVQYIYIYIYCEVCPHIRYSFSRFIDPGISVRQFYQFLTKFNCQLDRYIKTAVFLDIKFSSNLPPSSYEA